MAKDPSVINIIEGLTKGTVTITKMEEFNKVLAEYPDSPFVNRLVADFLKKKNSYPNAINRYKKTYGLFMAEGETLHAIAALMELWEIVKPAPYEFRSLHSLLRRRNTHNSAIDECFAAMSYQELRAILPELGKIRVKTGEIVQHPDEPEETLYFVISGELVKSLLNNEKNNGKSDQFVLANDHFGNDHPLEVKGAAPYQVKATSDSELLTIAKEGFIAISKHYPNLEDGFKKLAGDKQVPEAAKPEKFSRKHARQNLTTPLGLEIFHPDPGRKPTSAMGLTSDISLGGTRVVVDPECRAILDDDIGNRKIMLRFSLQNESISVLIIGKIVWHNETEVNGQLTRALGIQFDETPPRVRAAMIFLLTALSSAGKGTAD